MTKKSPQIKYIGIITSVYSVRKMGSASLYRNSRKDSSVSETAEGESYGCWDLQP